jgi:hypothetical protein
MEDWEKEFVSYDLASRMKELGFAESCWCYFMNDVFNSSMFPKDYEYFEVMSKKHTTYTLAPTFSQSFRWFRKKYGLYSWIQLHNGYINDSFYPELPITFSIMDRKTGNKYYERDIPHNYLYKTNEEAELECLSKLIEIIEKTKEDEKR